MPIDEIIESVTEADITAAENVERMIAEENRALDGMLMLAHD